MKAIVKILIIVATAFAVQPAMAQKSYTQEAYECYKLKDFECARVWIDSAITTQERTSSQTWQLRGIVYRELEAPGKMHYRDIAIESFVQARNLDVDNVDQDKITSYLKNTVVRYYNDAVSFLEGNELDNSESFYEKYKSKQKEFVNASENFQNLDIEFYNALGGGYMNSMKILESGDKREKMKLKGISLYERVLKLAADNFQANFNIGLVYYNEGVDITYNMRGRTDLPIEEMLAGLDRSERQFSLALPYLTKAVQIDPNDEDAVEGLTGCYYGLNDDANYNKYREILDKMIIDDLLREFEKNPKDIELVKELCRIYSTTIKNEQQYDKFNAVYKQLLKEQDN
jgi:tetratricopeptide (TPR) repeat protein